jgi:hypothetical protein
LDRRELRPERLLWASDFTRLRFVDGTTLRAPMADWYGLYWQSLTHLLDTPELSPGEKELILGGNVRRLLGWPKTGI